MSSNVLASLFGLLVALRGPTLLVSPANRLLGKPDSIATKLREQAVLWLFLAIVLAVVLLWERQALSSIWLQRLHWQSPAWGLALAGVMMYLVFPVQAWILRVSGPADFQAGLQSVLALPLWGRGFVLSLLPAGAVSAAFFIWRQDLLAMIVAHTVVDTMGLIVRPPVSTRQAALR